MTNANDTSPDGREDSDEPTDNDRLQLTRRLTVAGAATAAVGSLPTVATADDDDAGLDPDNTVRGPTDDHPRAEWRVEPADVSVVVDTDHVFGSVTTATDTTVRVRADPVDERVVVHAAAATDSASGSGEVRLTERQAAEIGRRLRDAAGDGGRLARSASEHVPVDAAVPSVQHAGELSLSLDEPRVEVYRERDANVMNTHGAAGNVTCYWGHGAAAELADVLDDAADWATGRR